MSWGCGSEALDQVARFGAGWLATHDAQIRARVGKASFWADGGAATQMIVSGVNGYGGSAFAQSYQEDRQEVRTVGVRSPGQLALTTVSAGPPPWRDTITGLRDALLVAPRDRLAVGMISHLDWGDYLYTQPPGAEFYSRTAYTYYPECRSEYTLDPCGIQVLTDWHLAKANDLSGWDTTKLDDHHYLVEARDLEPWYAKPLGYRDPVPADLIEPARKDFGDMIMTHTKARELGMDVKPPISH